MPYLSIRLSSFACSALLALCACATSSPSTPEAGVDASRSDAAAADVVTVDALSTTDVTLDAGAESAVADAPVVDSSRDATAADASRADAARADGSTRADGGTADVILSYTYGSQINGSRLHVYLDGFYEVFERSCCPPNEVPTTGTLSASQLDALTLNIVAIVGSTDETLEGMAALAGSLSGTLEVQATGSLRIVQNIARPTNPDGGPGNHTVTRSRAAVARNAILDLVDALTLQDMYRLP